MSGTKKDGMVYCAGCGARCTEADSAEWVTCDDCGDVWCPDCSDNIEAGVCIVCAAEDTSGYDMPDDDGSDED